MARRERVLSRRIREKRRAGHRGGHVRGGERRFGEQCGDREERRPTTRPGGAGANHQDAQLETRQEGRPPGAGALPPACQVPAAGT